MIVRINNVLQATAEPDKKSWIDRYNEWADYMIDKETEIFVKPAEAAADHALTFIGEKISEGFHTLIAVLNGMSAEIITLGVIGCAFGFMLSPIWNGGATKWSGRLFVTLLLGVVWRMLIP